MAITDEQLRKIYAEASDPMVLSLVDEISRLKGKLDTIHTVVPCESCRIGVRQRYAVRGMCVDCAASEIDRLKFECGDWIGVKDKLPEIGQVVVMRYQRKGFRPSFAFGGRAYVGCDTWLWGRVDWGEVHLDEENEIVSDDDYPVTHWKPIGEPRITTVKG